MAAIVIADVTTGIVAGTGAFDKIMDSVNAHLTSEYAKGRLKGSDYATVYLGSMQSAMSQAVQFVLGQQQADKQADLIATQNLEVAAATIRNDTKTTAEVNLLNQKTFTEEAQINDTVNAVAVAGVIGKQKLLFTAQTTGFTRDAEQKALKIMLDVYAVQRSTDVNAVVPNNATAPDIGAFIKVTGDGIGVLGLT